MLIEVVCSPVRVRGDFMYHSKYIMPVVQQTGCGLAYIEVLYLLSSYNEAVSCWLCNVGLPDMPSHQSTPRSTQQAA